MWIHPLVKIELEALQLKATSPYVFASRVRRAGHRQQIQAAWRKTRERAKLYCRFHDLRHSFLSQSILTQGLSPALVSLYAGVSVRRIEQTYLHPKAETLAKVGESMRLE